MVQVKVIQRITHKHTTCYLIYEGRPHHKAYKVQELTIRYIKDSCNQCRRKYITTRPGKVYCSSACRAKALAIRKLELEAQRTTTLEDAQTAFIRTLITPST